MAMKALMLTAVSVRNSAKP